MAATLTGLTLSPSAISKNPTIVPIKGTITFSERPDERTDVTITDNVPVNLANVLGYGPTVPCWDTTNKFDIYYCVPASYLTAPVVITVTATAGDVSKTATLTVGP